MVKIFVAGPVNSAHVYFPEIGHREPEFEEIYKKVKRNLFKLFKADKKDFDIAMIGGSGTAAIESVLSSVAEWPYIIFNGAFGERLRDICEIYKINYSFGKCSWGEYPDLKHMEGFIKTNPQIKEVVMVYMETSTGMLNPIREVGKLCKKYNKTFIVDAVSAIGAEKLDMNKDNIDFCIANTNKGIGGPAVMGVVCCRKSKINLKKRSFYLDLSKYLEYGESNQTPFTPAIPLFYMMDESLTDLFEEGLDNRIERYRKNTELLRKELKKLGLKIYLKDHLSNAMTNVYIPKGHSYEGIHNKLKKKGFLIYPGKGELLGKAMHIATMGTITEEDVMGFIKCLKEVLKMPRKDKTGPPTGAKGPRDGRGKGKGRASGKGAGSMTGGKKGKK